MGATGKRQDFELAPHGVSRVIAMFAQEDRRFYVGLLVALLCHCLLLIGFTSTKSRQLGDPSGSDNAISVSIATEADLRGDATVADSAAGVPTPVPSESTPAATPIDPPTARQEPQADAQQPAAPREESAATENTPAKNTTAKDAVAPLPKSVLLPVPELAPETPEVGRQPQKSAKSSDPEQEARKRVEPQKAKPQRLQPAPKRTTMLDLSPPPQSSLAGTITSLSGRGGAGVERPPGTTRSGENDDFAKGVIRALQRTMPQLSDTFGRVTVRITLDKSGGLVGTRVLRASNVAGLDQSVVFSTQQASFPFPPRNAVAADVIFIVTYIYR